MNGFRTPAGAVVVTLVAVAAACTAPTRTERYDPGEHVYVLPGADTELDKAIASAERAGPDADPTLLASLRLTREGRDLIAEGRDDRAYDRLERAIAVNGDQGFSYLYLAHLHIEAGDATQGLVFLDRAESLLPRSRALDAVSTALLERAAGGSVSRKTGGS